MMGGGMGMMGNPMMGMGMPFMTYDTMEDLLLDPDRPDMRLRGPGPMAGAAVAGAAARAASVRAASAALPRPTVGGATSVVQPAASVPAQTGGAVGRAATVDQSMIASALQTALSRVGQRQTQGTVTG